MPFITLHVVVKNKALQPLQVKNLSLLWELIPPKNVQRLMGSSGEHFQRLSKFEPAGQVGQICICVSLFHVAYVCLNVAYSKVSSYVHCV